ncbi:related to CCR4-component of the major cytoplasmic deadenylase (C-terminal fragment) [Serendipita indica DSM 11827]|uniref:CCR4-Not complex 3'-5'-exoribonuclease subunit Ccr4 n=1 Tax=Serendipita indica (strain DSM 11827) TaxID=1109443 RepID=G4TKF1_SERID|nr:related to CCR4-component of the major cytoplasmic deadenylase (C-terminal fragment) [Serendipita indica DSM 11827]
MNPHWSAQLMKAELCRQASPQHHRARQSALATRNAAKSAIPITNPNLKNLLAVKENGHARDDSQSSLVTESSGTQEPADGEHPSSTSAPIAQIQRPTAPRKAEGTWTILDMGGMALKNLSPGLFTFNFLTTLYLNHNNLTTIPSEISRLRGLIHLDLTGNQLTIVPPALGMLTGLRELFLFDNNLSTLPYQLGSLHQLEMLGIEGNLKMDEKIRSIAINEGTIGVIAYLRDNFMPTEEPRPRKWVQVGTEAERKALPSDTGSVPFSVLCYNILCEKYATSQMYGYTPTWALAWSHRKDRIMSEILDLQSDIVCLQEVDQEQFQTFFQPTLLERGYESCYSPKSRAKTMTGAKQKEVDGSATFFKADKFKLVENVVIEFRANALQRTDLAKTDDIFNRVAQRDDIALTCLLEERQTGIRLIVANAHIFWDPEYRDVKLVQVSLLVHELEAISDRFAKLPPMQNADGTKGAAYDDGSKISTLICGDFNSVPDSGVYQLLSTGSVQGDHPDFMGKNYGKFTTSGVSHRLGLRSAYAGIGELPVTNYTPSFRGGIDYIWYSTQSISVLDVLGEVDEEYLGKVVGFPNAHFPSDHIHISAQFVVKPPRETTSKAGPPGLRRPA